MITSQKENREQMLIEAKALSIKSPHFYGDEALAQKIKDEKAKPEQSGADDIVKITDDPATEGFDIRKPAPDMAIRSTKEGERERVVRELEDKDPESRYIYGNPNMSDEWVASKRYQRTPFTVGNSVLFRVSKKSFEEKLRERNDTSLESMKRIDKAELAFKGHVASAKKPPPLKT